MAVRRLKDGRYAVEFEQAGERVFRRCPKGVRKEDAEQYEATLRRALFRRQALGEQPVVPLAAAIELWLKETTADKRDQKKPRQNAILLAEFIGNRTLEESPAVAQAAVLAWTVPPVPIPKDWKPLKSSTVNRRLAVLKAVCKHAWRRGLIDRNLSGMIPLLREPAPREVYLSPREISKLARAAPDPTTKAAIMILAYSGLRIGELLAMPAVPRNAKDLTVPAEVSKTGKPRLVPIVDTIRPYLRALPIGMPYRTWVEGFWSARKVAGMPHVRPHDLRHTCASLLAAKHVPLNIIADILGDHPLTARRYTHLLQKTKREAMRRIG